MRNVIILGLSAAVVFGGCDVFHGKSGSNLPTIKSLADHFTAAGLAVATANLSSEEKEMVDDFSKTISGFKKAYGVKTDTNKAPVESVLLTINGIKTHIYRYKTPEAAKNAYNYKVGLEQRKEADAAKRSYRYLKREHLLSGYFFMSISHFHVDVKAQKSVPLQLNDSDLRRIKDVFGSFK